MFKGTGANAEEDKNELLVARERVYTPSSKAAREAMSLSALIDAPKKQEYDE